MKRRDFLVSSAGMLGAVAPLLGRAQTPCPPPGLSVEGGSSVATACGQTNLSEAAASLSPGQSTTSLGDSGLSSAALFTIQWANRFHVDAGRGRAYLIGKNAASQGSERSNCLYDFASNRWSASVFGGSETGHVYESFALDPERSTIYTGDWNGDTLKSWTHGAPLNSWDDPATSPFRKKFTGGTQPALCWHPNLFGGGDGGLLALVTEGGDGAAIVSWRRSNNQWYAVQTVDGMSGSYRENGAIEYIAGGDFCIAALPASQGGRTYRIDAGSGGSLSAAVQIADAPMHCGYTGGGNVGILLDDPSGAPSAYILEKGGGNRVWKFSDGRWASRSYKHPFPTGGVSDATNWVVATCRTLGVFWSRSSDDRTPSRLWKPND